MATSCGSHVEVSPAQQKVPGRFQQAARDFLERASEGQDGALGLEGPADQGGGPGYFHFHTLKKREESGHENVASGVRIVNHASMAFRIHESVVRGEIDNRMKGVVRGKVWIEGRAGPIVLELRGNAWPDLAGCLLTFTNPQKRLPDARLDSLHPIQRGSIGDLTASRKVRVFDVPLEEALDMFRRKEKPPEHIANSLYLEWFSEANGRVVIESADYELTISAPEWRLSPEEEAARASQAAAGMVDFMGRLTKAMEQQQRGQKDPEPEGDEQDDDK